MRHAEATELLASFALDAVSPGEHQEIETHLAQCPRCRAELDGYREVAAAMGNSVEPLPEGLWTSIAARLPERADEDAHPMPRLTGRRPGRSGPATGAGRGRGIASISAVAVAAAAVAVVLGIGLVRADNQANHDSSLLAAKPHTVTHTISATEAALRTPGHKLVTLAGWRTHTTATVHLWWPRRPGLSRSPRSLPTLSAEPHLPIVGRVVDDGKPISLSGCSAPSRPVALHLLHPGRDRHRRRPSWVASRSNRPAGSVVPERRQWWLRGTVLTVGHIRGPVRFAPHGRGFRS